MQEIAKKNVCMSIQLYGRVQTYCTSRPHWLPSSPITTRATWIAWKIYICLWSLVTCHGICNILQEANLGTSQCCLQILRGIAPWQNSWTQRHCRSQRSAWQDTRAVLAHLRNSLYLIHWIQSLVLRSGCGYALYLLVASGNNSTHFDFMNPSCHVTILYSEEPCFWETCVVKDLKKMTPIISVQKNI